MIFKLVILLNLFEIGLNGAASSSDESVRLHVFTNKKQNVTFDMKNTSYSLNKICDPTIRPMYKFIVHGFAERWDMDWRWDWVGTMIKEMSESPDASKLCIIAVDWAELSRGGLVANYWKAIENMQVAADIMVKYFRVNRINEKNMHCIGFSLGAHMCAIFYKTYFAQLKVKPERITGLDPAGPFYKSKPFNEKLHHTDANFVDIIHTSEHFGLPEKNGHMDFYPDQGPSE